MFSISGNRGFQMTFENGYTVSVQFGPGNYCDNNGLPWAYVAEQKSIPDSKNAETALIRGGKEFVGFAGVLLQKNMTPEMVLDLLNHARDLPQYVKKNYC